MAALARWCLRRRLVVMMLWAVALLGVGTAAAVAGPAYSADYGISGTESAKAADLLHAGFPQQSSGADRIVWQTDGASPGVRAPQAEQQMNRTLHAVAALPGVAEVDNPYPSSGADRISPDGGTAYAVVHFDRPSGSVSPQDVDAVVHTALSANGHVDGLQVAVGGPDVKDDGGGSAHLSEAVGVAVAAIVLFLAFGSLAAMTLPLVTALVSVGTAYLGIGLLGHAMTVADFAPMLGSLIGLGVGIDYALFIVTRHRRGLRQGLPVTEAAQRAVGSAGRAVVFAGVTVCIALLGMLVLRLGFLNGVAIAASLTVILAVLASITLLPALLGVIGDRALSRRERTKLATAGPAAAEGGPGPAARWSALIERRPRLLGALAATVMLVLALPVAGLHLGSSDQGAGPAKATTRQAYDMLSQGFGPGVNGPLTLVADVDGAAGKLAFDQLPKQLRDTRGVARVSDARLNGSGDTGIITVVPDTGPQDPQTSELVDRLRDRILPRSTDDGTLRVHVGGVTAGHDDFAAAILHKLPLFLGVVVALGCALLLLAFRSVGIPLKAALMNVLAVSASFGIVVAVFQWGWGSSLLGLGGGGPIEPFLPVIMIAVLFGLSMDYQVFLVSRMYEEWQLTGDNRRAVRVGLAETGQVINSAAAIMIAVFGAFVLSGDRIIAMFGIGLAAAVALDAFVLRTLLVPALMHLLGGANWWLPGWLERLLPRLSIEPPAVPVPADSEAGLPPTALVPAQSDPQQPVSEALLTATKAP